MFTLSVRNYRCFGNTPGSLPFAPGFHAIVGTNDAGKSSLLRIPFELRDYFGALQTPDGLASRTSLSSLQQIRGPLTQIDHDSIRNSITGRMPSVTLSFPSDGTRDIVDSATLEWKDVGNWVVQMNSRGRHVHGGVAHIGEHLVVEPGFGTPRYSVKEMVAAVQELNDSMYLPAFRSPTSGGSGQAWYDISLGVELVNKLREFQAGRTAVLRERFRVMERSLGRVLGIDDLGVDPNPSSGEILVSARGASRPLHEMGSGIGQIIAGALAVAARNPTYLLIDEPEIHLHPALQQEYLSLLGAHTKKGVVFATHSLGLARSVCARVTLVSRQPDQTSVASDLDDPKKPIELLGALQYGAYSSIGLRKVLLVEGPSECLAIRQWLRLLGKDTEIMLLPLGGRTLINGNSGDVLNEIKRFGSPVACLIDSDGESPGAPLAEPRPAFLEICKKLNIEALATERRAFENYLPQSAISVAFPDVPLRALGPHEKRYSGCWGKESNWKIARCMSKIELLATDVGQFLSGL